MITTPTALNVGKDQLYKSDGNAIACVFHGWHQFLSRQQKVSGAPLSINHKINTINHAFNPRWIGLMAVAALLILVMACSSNVEVAREVQDVKPEINISAYDLLGDYLANEVGADLKYKNRIVLVDGVIDRFVSSTEPKVYFAGGSGLTELSCGFSPVEARNLADLRMGQEVTFKGKVTGKGPFDVEIKGCTIHDQSSTGSARPAIIVATPTPTILPESTIVPDTTFPVPPAATLSPIQDLALSDQDNPGGEVPAAMLDQASPVASILDPGTMAPAEQIPSPISTNDSTLGDSRSRPAPIGSELTIVANDFFSNYQARVVLVEVVRGEAAANLVARASEINSYLGNLDTGFEYALARIRFDYLKGADLDTVFHLSSVKFTAVSFDGKEYDRVIVVGLDPDLSADLYPGASQEGWAAFQVAKTDLAPLMTFGRDFDGRGGLWWKLSKSSTPNSSSFATTNTSTPAPTLVPRAKVFEGRMGQITEAFFLKEGKVTFATTYRGGQGSALTVYLRHRNGEDVELIAHGRVLYSSPKVVHINEPGYYILDVEAGDGVWSIEVD